jgi:alpha-ribazole phosphatase/probable phosphoglycerate mutase
MTPATRSITLIRHAPTANNADAVITGRIDAPLSDEGRDFATAFVEREGHLNADVAVSSPLIRAVETASILFDLDSTTVVTNDLCIERDYGQMEGAPAEEVAAMGVTYLEAGGIRHSLDPPDGETFQEVRKRADAFREQILDTPDAHVACVTHQVFLQQLHGALRGLDIESSLAIDIAPLAICTYTVEQRSVVGWTDVFRGAEHVISW